MTVVACCYLCSKMGKNKNIVKKCKSEDKIGKQRKKKLKREKTIQKKRENPAFLCVENSTTKLCKMLKKFALKIIAPATNRAVFG